jgi:hypothetical protein
MIKSYFLNFFERNSLLEQVIIGFFLIVFTIGIAGCSDSISIDNDTISSQITDYLNNDTREGFMSNVSFAECFNIENITVKDKLVEDKKCTALVEITVSTKKSFAKSSGVTMAYDFIVGNIA